MMDSGHLLRDQFRARASNDGAPGPSVWRLTGFLQLVPGSLAAAAVFLVKAYPQGGPGAVLSATSILTGFTFAMALHMWKSSLDARRDDRYAFDPLALETLDGMRTRLIWTVGVGVTSSAWFAGMWLFSIAVPARWALAAGVFLFAYQVTLVVGALANFYKASLTLR